MANLILGKAQELYLWSYIYFTQIREDKLKTEFINRKYNNFLIKFKNNFT